MVLEHMIWGNTIKNYLISVFILLFAIGIGHLFSTVIVKLIKKIAAKTDTLIDDILINVLEKPFVFALFIVGVYLIQFYMTFSTRGHEIYQNILEILIVLNITWVIIRLTDAVIEHYLTPLVQKSESDLDDHLLPFAKNVVRVLIVLIAIIFLIKHFGYDVTSLVAGLGIGGLAFALAAQPLLTNLFGGLAIIADKPFAIGDRVRIDDRFEGYVVQIGMRSTTIRTGKDTILHVPNSVVASTVVENLATTKDHSIRHTFDVGVTYQTSNEKLQQAIDIIKKILDENPNVVKNDAASEYYVGFSKFADSALIISVGYSHTIGGVTAKRSQINMEIKKRFESAGIDFAYPTQTVHVKQDVKLEHPPFN